MLKILSDVSFTLINIIALYSKLIPLIFQRLPDQMVNVTKSFLIVLPICPKIDLYHVLRVWS